MKKIIFLSFLLCASVFISQAQTQQPSAKVKQEVELIRKADLGLTDVQISRLTTVLMGEEKNLEMSNKAQQETRLKLHHDNKIRNIKGVMSAAQAEKFDALKLGDKL
jgi:hypothetical protein